MKIDKIEKIHEEEICKDKYHYRFILTFGRKGVEPAKIGFIVPLKDLKINARNLIQYMTEKFTEGINKYLHKNEDINEK